MKRFLYLTLIFLASSYAFGQARLGIYPWTVTLKVVGDDGLPVPGAKAKIDYYSKGHIDSIQGLTDTNGLFVATHKDSSLTLGMCITKSGYYPTSGGYQLFVPGQFAVQKVEDNRNPMLKAVLKKVVHPIPMYAKSLNTRLPDLDKPIGYDLMVGDWTNPYGSGLKADILFTGHFDKYTNGESDYTLTVSFPNKGDGIQEFNAPVFAQEALSSKLRSLQETPLDGYQAKWVQTDNRSPGVPIETNRDPHHNYYIRVRTQMDDRGQIVSAYYGKIYGDFMRFSYYLNPTPNDRNIEFDPKQNLIKINTRRWSMETPVKEP